jgi:hypothetical protein
VTHVSLTDARFAEIEARAREGDRAATATLVCLSGLIRSAEREIEQSTASIRDRLSDDLYDEMERYRIEERKRAEDAAKMPPCGHPECLGGPCARGGSREAVRRG